jgi:hypothetical protein
MQLSGQPQPAYASKNAFVACTCGAYDINGKALGPCDSMKNMIASLQSLAPWCYCGAFKDVSQFGGIARTAMNEMPGWLYHTEAKCTTEKIAAVTLKPEYISNRIIQLLGPDKLKTMELDDLQHEIYAWLAKNQLKYTKEDVRKIHEQISKATGCVEPPPKEPKPGDEAENAGSGPASPGAGGSPSPTEGPVLPPTPLDDITHPQGEAPVPAEEEENTLVPGIEPTFQGDVNEPPVPQPKIINQSLESWNKLVAGHPGWRSRLKANDTFEWIAASDVDALFKVNLLARKIPVKLLRKAFEDRISDQDSLLAIAEDLLGYAPQPNGEPFLSQSQAEQIAAQYEAMLPDKRLDSSDQLIQLMEQWGWLSEQISHAHDKSDRTGPNPVPEVGSGGSFQDRDKLEDPVEIGTSDVFQKRGPVMPTIPTNSNLKSQIREAALNLASQMIKVANFNEDEIAETLMSELKINEADALGIVDAALNNEKRVIAGTSDEWGDLVNLAESGNQELDKVTMLMAEVWNGGFDQFVNNLRDEAPSYLRASQQVFKSLGTPEGNKMAQILSQISRMMQSYQGDSEAMAQAVEPATDEFYAISDALKHQLWQKYNLKNPKSKPEAAPADPAQPNLPGVTKTAAGACEREGCGHGKNTHTHFAEGACSAKGCTCPGFVSSKKSSLQPKLIRKSIQNDVITSPEFEGSVEGVDESIQWIQANWAMGQNIGLVMIGEEDCYYVLYSDRRTEKEIEDVLDAYIEHSEPFVQKEKYLAVLMEARKDFENPGDDDDEFEDEGSVMAGKKEKKEKKKWKPYHIWKKEKEEGKKEKEASLEETPAQKAERLKQKTSMSNAKPPLKDALTMTVKQKAQEALAHLKKDAKYFESHRKSDTAGSPWEFDPKAKRLKKKPAQMNIQSTLDFFKNAGFKFKVGDHVFYSDGVSEVPAKVKARIASKSVGDDKYYEVEPFERKGSAAVITQVPETLLTKAMDEEF